MAPIVR